MVFFFVAMLLFVFFLSVRYVPKDKCLVVSRLGRTRDVRGPGLIFIVPFIESAKALSLSPTVCPIEVSDAPTTDLVKLGLKTTMTFAIRDPKAAVEKVADFQSAMLELGRTMLAKTCADWGFEKLLIDQEEFAKEMLRRMNESSKFWGIEVTKVEKPLLEVPPEIVRAMEKTALAEQQGRKVK